MSNIQREDIKTIQRWFELQHDETIKMIVEFKELKRSIDLLTTQMQIISALIILK